MLKGLGVGRLGKESKSSKQSHSKSNSDITSSNNIKSNNINSTIHGDNHYKVTVNYNSWGPVVNSSSPAVQSSVNNGPGLALRSLGRPSESSFNSDSITSSSSTSLLNSNTQNPGHGTISSTNIPGNRVHWGAANDGGRFGPPSASVPHVNSRRMSSTNSVGWSLFSDSQSNLPQPIRLEDVKRHLPKHTENYIKSYMTNGTFFKSKSVIPLWKPSPSHKSEVWTWKHHIYVGDVGFFNDGGGFTTIFNIFNSRDENLARGYDPPSDFVCYSQSFDGVKLDFDPQVEYRIKFNGFEFASQQKKRDPINSTYKVTGSNCSAIYLNTGYREISLKHWDRLKVLRYVQDNQDSWQQHVEEVAGTQARERPLVIIFASYRTQNYALAAGCKHIFKKWEGGITLKKSVKGSHTLYSWEADDDLIYTESAPSPELLESLDSYFKDMDEGKEPDCGPEGRKETMECHCVGIKAFCLRKKAWRGSSILTGRSSKNTIRPLTSIPPQA